MVHLRIEKGQCISRQTALPLRYLVHTQRLTNTNQADSCRPVLEHERSDVTQQLPQFLEPLLCALVHICEVTLAERELLDRSEITVLVKGMMNVWGLGEEQLGICL